MDDQSDAAARTADEQVRGGSGGERHGVRTVLLAIIAVVLVGWALHAAATVAVPLAASILVALAVMPVREWVRRKVPERWGWLGIVAAMALLLLVAGLFFGALWLAAQQVAGEFPADPGQAAQAQPQGGSAPDGAGAGLPLGLPGEARGAGAATDETPSAAGPAQGLQGLLPASAPDLAARFGNTVVSAATVLLESVMAIVSALVVIFFLTLLILIESGDWRRKIASVTQPRNEWRLTESAEVIARKVRAYLLIRTVLGIITAVLYGLWLWLFGVGLVVVWAILTFLLNFIPTVGSIIAGLLPTAYAAVTQDFGTALAVGAGLLVIEQVMGNFVDPKLAGSRTAVSPLVVLVALLLWSWLWGIPGALLAVPVTVSLIVLGAHVPALRPWALLLSDRTDMEGLKDATRPKGDG